MTNAHLSCVPGKLGDLLDEAATLCADRDGNLTPLRKKVLKLLLEADRPSKAYDLLQHLREDGEAKPPTIYRTLEFLVEMGLAHRLETLQAYVPCGHWKHDHTAVFLICEMCGEVSELDSTDSLRKLGQEAGSVGFKASNAVVEVRGVCSKCS